MANIQAAIFLFLITIEWASCMIPPKFQWKTIDFAWQSDEEKQDALLVGSYVPEHNMPTGLARWRNKLFITIPRWKKGVISSLNYVDLNGSSHQPLKPYPSWGDAFLAGNSCCVPSNATVVSTFRVHVDPCDRLWVVDNGVAEMAGDVKQIIDPAVVVFDLRTDTVIKRFLLPHEVLRDESALTSIVVDIVGKDENMKNCSCPGEDAFAYITDMGSNAVIVYSLKDDEAWRIQHPYFNFDPEAGLYSVGGVDFFWNDGVSSAALSQASKDGHRDLYFHPTSSTKQFKMSTKLLRNKYASKGEMANGVKIVGDRGPNSQSTACDFDAKTNVLFFTQLSKNGIGCWNSQKPFNEENTPVIIRDCQVMEFPNDVKVDYEGKLWILSDRQSRFLYESMDFKQTNFRVLTAPVKTVIQGTTCQSGKLKKSSGIFERSSFV